MRVFTTHLRQGVPPVLVQEGFSLGALLLGPVWLLIQGAWVAAFLNLAAWLLLGQLAALPYQGALTLGLVALQGLFGRDLVRWNLGLRGYVAGPPVAAGDEDAALLRLLTERADLVADVARTAA